MRQSKYHNKIIPIKIGQFKSHRAAHNGPVSSGLGEGLARWALLGPSCSSDSLWRDGRLQSDIGRQLDGVSSNTLVRLASGLDHFANVKESRMALAFN